MAMRGVVDQARGLDQTLGEHVSGLGNFLDYVWFPSLIIDQFQHLPNNRRVYRNDLPRLVDVAQRVFGAFQDYHITILAETSKRSNDVKKATERCVSVLLYPLSITAAGDAVRSLIAKDVLGNVMKAVSFVFFQVFHLVPYFLLVTGFKVINMVYIRYPVALLTGIMGSMLFLQLYFLYRLGKEVEITNKIMADGLALADKRTDLGDLKKKASKGTVGLIAAGMIYYAYRSGYVAKAMHQLGQFLVTKF
jgi:hypothetical protein